MRAQVVVLLDVGFSQIQISKQLNISHCCVQSVINKDKHLGTHEDSNRSASPETLNGQGFRHLK